MSICRCTRCHSNQPKCTVCRYSYVCRTAQPNKHSSSGSHRSSGADIRRGLISVHAAGGAPFEPGGASLKCSMCSPPVGWHRSRHQVHPVETRQRFPSPHCIPCPSWMFGFALTWQRAYHTDPHPGTVSVATPFLFFGCSIVGTYTGFATTR